jgi:hypothetical protein
MPSKPSVPAAHESASAVKVGASVPAAAALRMLRRCRAVFNAAKTRSQQVQRAAGIALARL